MGDNQLIVEMGTPDLSSGPEKAMEVLGGLHNMAAGWKAEGVVDAVHEYMMVTGNRTDRSVMFVIEMSHDQLEQFVNSKPWIEFMMYAQANCANFTTNRSLDVERLFAEQGD